MRDEGKPELITKGTNWAYFERYAESLVVQIISISSFKALAHWKHAKYFKKQGREHNGRALNTFIVRLGFSFSFGKQMLTVCVVPTTTAIAATWIGPCACVFIFFSFPFKRHRVRQKLFSLGILVLMHVRYPPRRPKIQGMLEAYSTFVYVLFV